MDKNNGSLFDVKPFLRPIVCFLFGAAWSWIIVTLLSGMLLSPAGIVMIAFGILLVMLPLRFLSKTKKARKYPLGILYYVLGFVFMVIGLKIGSAAVIAAVIVGAALSVFIDRMLIKDDSAEENSETA